MKSKLVFDVTDANTILDSDSVGAYLRSADGTLLTHTDVGGKKALDVRVAEGINVEVDLTFAEDSVDVSGSIVALDAPTLAALESITVQNGAGAAAVNIQDGGNSITVDAVDLDIRDLAFATDKVDVSGSTITANVSDAALANTAIATGKTELTVASTPIDAVASPTANRKYLWLYNNDNRTMFIGSNDQGFPLPPQSYVQMRAGDAVDVQVFSTKAAHDMRFMELA